MFFSFMLLKKIREIPEFLNPEYPAISVSGLRNPESQNF